MRVLVGDVRLFVEVLGQEWVLDGERMRRRPVLVGLHGGPGLDATRLRYQLVPLAEVAQVVVPDQRGHGRSDHGTPETWNLTSWAADAKELCDILDIEHPVVLGSSFGGFVAQQYASAYPDHPAALILVSTCARTPDVEETVARFRELGGEEAAEVVRRDFESPSEETLAEWIRVCAPLLTRAADPDPLIARLQAARIETMDVNLHYMTGEGKAMDLRSRLRNVRCPTLVVLGEHDPLMPVHLGEEIVASIPNGLARLEVIEDAAHDVVTDNPEHAYRCIREFVTDLV